MISPISFRGPHFTSASESVLSGPGVEIHFEDESLRPWAIKARDALVTWYPKVAKMLHATPLKPTETIIVTIETHGDGVAATGGHHMTVNGDYIRRFPNDVGLIVHEEAHVVQGYPHYNPVWLVEGIADWVRWFHYEPKAKRPHPNAKTWDYHHSYQQTAAFLFWAGQKYNKNLVPDLNTALTDDTYSADTWTKETGFSLDALSDQYKAYLLAHPPVRRTARTGQTTVSGSQVGQHVFGGN